MTLSWSLYELLKSLPIVATSDRRGRIQARLISDSGGSSWLWTYSAACRARRSQDGAIIRDGRHTRRSRARHIYRD